MRTCTECGRPIDKHEEFLRQDRTGNPFCLECGDYHNDVTIVKPRDPADCSCSRGGNAITCECRAAEVRA